MNWNFSVSNSPGRLRTIVHEEWPIDGSASQGNYSASYNAFFQQSLNGRSLDEWAIERRRQNKTTHVIDFFGSAVFSEKPELYDSLTGVRFKALNPEALPPSYPAHNWQNVIGDVYTRGLWRELNNQMTARNIPFFDLVIIRPYGPLTGQTNVMEIINNGWIEGQGDKIFFRINGAMILRIHKLLNPDGGLMLIELNEVILSSPLFSGQIKKLEDYGAKVTVFETPTDGQGGKHLKVQVRAKPSFQ